MSRTPAEIQADIQKLKAEIAKLPAWALREGLDDDYQGQIDALEDELKQAEEPEE